MKETSSYQKYRIFTYYKIILADKNGKNGKKNSKVS
jgi:hypothetical protein